MSGDRSSGAAGDPADQSSRQRLERVPGARRVRLTAAPGTLREPVAGDHEGDHPAPPVTRTVRAATGTKKAETGPNDARLRREVPPHY